MLEPYSVQDDSHSADNKHCTIEQKSQSSESLGLYEVGCLSESSQIVTNSGEHISDGKPTIAGVTEPTSGDVSPVLFAHKKEKSNPKRDSHILSNIFSRLRLFFHDGGDFSLVTHLLVDMLDRNLYTFETILSHLRLFNAEAELDSTNKLAESRTFTCAVYKVLDDKYHHVILSEHVDSLANIVINVKGCFEEILSDLCREQQTHAGVSRFKLKGNTCPPNSSCSRIYLLEVCLKKINTGKSVLMRTIDQRLSCGETPLTLAARFRCAPVVCLLLQHGACVWSRWLCFNNVFEVLMFAPHTVYINNNEKQKIKECMGILLRATDYVKLGTEQHNRQEAPADMVPLVKNWKSLIPADRQQTTCSLKQLSNLTIRTVLQQNKNLPHGIDTLPLPTLLKAYINLAS